MGEDDRILRDIAGYCRTALIFGIEFFGFFGNLEN